MMPNLLQYPVALFGALRAGLTVVNVNPLYTATELKFQLNDSHAKAIVILSNFAHTLENILQETQIEHIVVTNIGDMLGPIKRTLVNFVVKYVKKMVPIFFSFLILGDLIIRNFSFHGYLSLFHQPRLSFPVLQSNFFAKLFFLFHF